MSQLDPRLVSEEDAKSDPFGVDVKSDSHSGRREQEVVVERNLAEPRENSKNNSDELGNDNICAPLAKTEKGQKVSKGVGQRNDSKAKGSKPGTDKPDIAGLPENTVKSQGSDEDMADYGQEIIQLPKTFVVKYLGQEDASGLWGIKYTRKPVDEMVLAAKNLKAPSTLPVVRLEVSVDGIRMTNAGLVSGGKNKGMAIIDEEFSIDTISYGVQDLVYTRVFAVIIVRESENVVEKHPFRCYGFVCDSRGNARKLTLALAKAFQEFSKALKAAESDPNRKTPIMRPKKLAIDLRSAEELQRDMNIEEDSEA